MNKNLNMNVAERLVIDAKESMRKHDVNGWFEIKDNPISREGVFPYSGAQLADYENSMGIDLNKIYNVYRPAEELKKQETIDSFKLIPIIDEHDMLGAMRDGLLPADEKGVHGMSGEQVYFDEKDGMFKANLKFISDKITNLIKSGKKQISIGYRCVYEKAEGIYNGQSFDFIQRNLFGNHIAIVDEGRSGPEVAVLDHYKFTFDEKGVVMADAVEEMKDIVKDEGEAEYEDVPMTLQECAAAIRELKDLILSKKAEAESEAISVGDEDMSAEKEEKMDEEAKKKEDKKDAMDSKASVSFDKKEFMVEIAKRDELAGKLSNFVGSFDKALMTHDEVAKYGVKKLGLDCAKGHEVSALKAFMLGKEQATPAFIEAADSAKKPTSLSSIIKGIK